MRDEEVGNESALLLSFPVPLSLSPLTYHLSPKLVPALKFQNIGIIRIA